MGTPRIHQRPPLWPNELFSIWHLRDQLDDEWVVNGLEIYKRFRTAGQKRLEAFARITNNCINREIDFLMPDQQAAKFPILVHNIAGDYRGFVAMAGQHTLLAAIIEAADYAMVGERARSWVSRCQSGVDHGAPVFFNIYGRILQ